MLFAVKPLWLATLLVFVFSFSAQAEELSKPSRKVLLKGVVSLVALEPISGRLEPVSSGTGTIVTKDGWIITNFHVVYDYDRAIPYHTIAVGITNTPKEKPQLICLADPQSGLSDKSLDIAIIKCDRDISGAPLSKKLQFTPVPLGDSDQVEIGDEIHVIGYPGVGGETITFTSGKISGFIGENGKTAGDEWFKTEADLAPGNSGGAAVNSRGELIGIPSQIHFDKTGYLSRTNLLRPIKFAKQFLDASLHNKPPTLIESDGVIVIGKLLEAGTQIPISGARIVFFKPGVTLREVTKKNIHSKIYAQATTDTEGDFRSSVPLARGQHYSVRIVASEYRTLQTDKGIETGMEGPPLFDLGEIELRKKRK